MAQKYEKNTLSDLTWNLDGPGGDGVYRMSCSRSQPGHAPGRYTQPYKAAEVAWLQRPDGTRSAAWRMMPEYPASYDTQPAPGTWAAADPPWRTRINLSVTRAMAEATLTQARQFGDRFDWQNALNIILDPDPVGNCRYGHCSSMPTILSAAHHAGERIAQAQKLRAGDRGWLQPRKYPAPAHCDTAKAIMDCAFIADLRPTGHFWRIEMEELQLSVTGRREGHMWQPNRQTHAIINETAGPDHRGEPVHTRQFVFGTQWPKYLARWLQDHNQAIARNDPRGLRMLPVAGLASHAGQGRYKCHVCPEGDCPEHVAAHPPASWLRKPWNPGAGRNSSDERTAFRIAETLAASVRRLADNIRAEMPDMPDPEKLAAVVHDLARHRESTPNSTDPEYVSQALAAPYLDLARTGPDHPRRRAASPQARALADIMQIASQIKPPGADLWTAAQNLLDDPEYRHSIVRNARPKHRETFATLTRLDRDPDPDGQTPADWNRNHRPHAAGTRKRLARIWQTPDPQSVRDAAELLRRHNAPDQSRQAAVHLLALALPAASPEHERAAPVWTGLPPMRNAPANQPRLL